MLETFTPAVCGSRKRQIARPDPLRGDGRGDGRGAGLRARPARKRSSARGARCSPRPRLALLAAAREAGLVRFPLPQARRQVPERWRFELPLPVWATGYGAGPRRRLLHVPAGLDLLGRLRRRAGARPAAFRPPSASPSTAWAARPWSIWPRRGAGDPTAAVERLTRRRGTLLRANAVALVACAVLLGGRARGRRSDVRRAGQALDPSVERERPRLRHAGRRRRRQAAVRARRCVYPTRPSPRCRATTSPTWTTRGSGSFAGRTARRSPVSTTSTSRAPRSTGRLSPSCGAGRTSRRLVVRNLRSGATKHPMKVPLSIDLGRPSLRNGRLAWHMVSRHGSRILVLTSRPALAATIAADEDRQADQPLALPDDG